MTKMTYSANPAEVVIILNKHYTEINVVMTKYVL